MKKQLQRLGRLAVATVSVAAWAALPQELDSGYAATTEPTLPLRLEVRRIEARSGRLYERADSGLRPGSSVYSRGSGRALEVPETLLGATYLRTAAEDADSHGEFFLSFEVPVPVTLYLGLDVRSDPIPGWLAQGGFIRTKETLVTSEARLDLWRRDYPAGKIVLGGNTEEGHAAGQAHYVVVFRPVLRENPPRPTRVQEVMDLAFEGQPERGFEWFFGEGGAGCWSCHQVNGLGHRFGPDLAGLAARQSVEAVVRSILEPDASLTAGYSQWQLRLKDGEILRGIRVEETDASLALAQPFGHVVRIDKDAILERSPWTTSGMPRYAEKLTPQQAADLVAWLMAQEINVSTPAHPDSPPWRETEVANWNWILEPDHLRLRKGDQDVGLYVFQDPAIRRPYFANLKSPGGLPITRQHPPVQGLDPDDHDTMHPGLWMAFGDINGHDFWRNKGLVEHLRFTDPPRLEQGRLIWAVENRYLTPGQADEICRERSSFSMFDDESGRWLIWRSMISPMSGPITFGAQEEMGVGIRIASEIRVKGGSGVIRNSLGGLNEKGTWGRTAGWWDYSGQSQGRHVGVMLVPDPAMERPSWGHTRDYGLIVMNPFSVPGPQAGSVQVGMGDSLAIGVAVLIHESDARWSTSDLDAAKELALKNLR